jgi:dTDP-4-amino-4,6-dideoxygalactose transaminase
MYHLYVVRTGVRDELQKHLTTADIGSGIHYPVPLHLQKAYGWLGYAEGDFPVAEGAAAEILSLPMFPGLKPLQQRQIMGKIAEFGSFPVRGSAVACAARI